MILIDMEVWSYLWVGINSLAFVGIYFLIFILIINLLVGVFGIIMVVVCLLVVARYFLFFFCVGLWTWHIV